MNKSIVFKLVLVLFIMSYLHSYSQNENSKFNGVIKYTISYVGEVDNTVISQQPNELVMKFNGNKIRTDIEEGGAAISVIKNGDNKTIITLMDISILNKKVMIKTKNEEIINKLSLLPTSSIKLLGETKEIAGYKCRKGELITKDDKGKESIDEFYYTDELGRGEYNFDSQYREVKGILMEYVTTEENIKVKATATSIDNKSISETEFMIPKGYEETTLEQLKSEFGNQ